MKENEIINKGELYTISLYHGKSNYDSVLEVVSNDCEVGELKASGNKNSILRIELELAYGNIHYYKWSVDYWLWGIRWLDKEDNQKTFKYEIKNLDKIKNEISKYNEFRLWIDKNDSNSFLFGLFFCYEFYDLIKDKKVKVVNLDNFYKTDKTITDLIKNKKIEENQLSLEDINKYKSEWDNQIEINSDIRDVRNGEIKNYKTEDLFKQVLDIIKPLGRANRMVAISKLQDSNILNNGHPLIYNYIIRCLIQNNTLKEYKIDYSKKQPDDNYVIDDEYRNNEIEYVGWRWCLVGNIVDKRIYGQDHEIKYGTKHFSPGTKVYIAPNQWGDGGENLVVLGNPRHKKGLIECVIRRDYICNFRLKKIYPSLVLDRMDNSEYEWWGNDDEWKKCIISVAEGRNDFNYNNKNVINNETKEEFLSNVDKISIKAETIIRIKNNLSFDNEDVLEFCKNKIKDSKCNVYRIGKNWYCEIENIRIIVNACSYTVVAANIIE